MVGGSAKGWTPPGPKLIGELVPGGTITDIYFLLPQFEKDSESSAKCWKLTHKIKSWHLKNIPHSFSESVYYTDSDEMWPRARK